MLVIVPNLSLNGAMTVLMELLPLFVERGYFLYILSPVDGDFREKVTEQGGVVFIRPYGQDRFQTDRQNGIIYLPV